MTERGYEFRKNAEDERSRGEYESAGNTYTLASHAYLAGSRYVEPPLERTAVDVGCALYSVLAAALCYRIAGCSERCTNRCRQGSIYCEDIRDHVARYDPQRGILNEYIGDFQVLAGNDWNDAYTLAAAHYDECQNEIGWMAEPEFDLNDTFMLQVAEAADFTIDQQTKHEITTTSLNRRIAFKRNHFENIVSEVISRGEWPA